MLNDIKFYNNLILTKFNNTTYNNNKISYKMIAGCNTRISLLENATYSFEERRGTQLRLKSS